MPQFKRKCSENISLVLTNIDAKHSLWPCLICVKFYIVFVKHVKWNIVPLIIVQLDLQVAEACICPHKIGYDMNSGKLTEGAILAIFVKQRVLNRNE